MSGAATAARAVPPWTLALGAMVSVQLGSALSVPLVQEIGAAAIERIPLGTAVAVEFLGPLTVAAVRSRSVQALVWRCCSRSCSTPWTCSPCAT